MKTNAEDCKQRRAKKLSLGLCIICGSRERFDGRTECAPCRVARLGRALDRRGGAKISHHCQGCGKSGHNRRTCDMRGSVAEPRGSCEWCGGPRVANTSTDPTQVEWNPWVCGNCGETID